MLRSRNILLVPHLNGGLLGDKVLLSAVIQASASSGLYTHVWGIEGREPFSMRYFQPRPWALAVDSIDEGIRRLVGKASSMRADRLSVLLCQDQHSRVLSDLGQLHVHVDHRDLWSELRVLQQYGITPKVCIPQRWLQRAARRLQRFNQREGGVLVAMHVRALKRQRHKNGDLDLFTDLARRLCRNGDRVLLVGAGDDRTPISQTGVLDLLPTKLPIEETAALLSLADVYVGGDSGPTHLAGAVGCPVVGLGYTTDKYGPFVPNWQLVARFGQMPSIRALVDAVDLAKRLVRRPTAESPSRCIGPSATCSTA